MIALATDNVMWASDYPHGDSTWPQSRQAIEESGLGQTRRGISAKDRMGQRGTYLRHRVTVQTHLTEAEHRRVGTSRPCWRGPVWWTWLVNRRPSPVGYWLTLVRKSPGSSRPQGSPLRKLPYDWAAWGAGTRSVVVSGPEDPGMDVLLAEADIVIDTPGFPDAWALDAARAPGCGLGPCHPFGSEGPRAGWRASDLGVMASSGNLWGTGYPDRAPVRCVYPTSYAHGGGEVVVAALSGLWVGRGQAGRRLFTAGDGLCRAVGGYRRVRHLRPAGPPDGGVDRADPRGLVHPGRIRHPRLARLVRCD